MNGINEKLAAAKKRQRAFYLLFGSVLITCLFAVGIIFTISRGTKVEIIPPEAAQDGDIKITDGVGVVTGNTIYSLLFPPQITVSSPGFKNAVLNLEKKDLGNLITIELFELPGRLMVTVTPADSELTGETVWTVGDDNKGVGNELDIELQAGSYKLRADNPFFTLHEQQIEINRGSNTDITIELEPAQGAIDITSSPQGADISINSASIGTTPLEVSIGAGIHKVQVLADNYFEISDTIRVDRNNSAISRNYRLQLKQATITGTVTPKGGTLLLNNVAVDGFPLTIDATVKHSLSYIKPGFYTETKNILLQPDEKKHIDFALRQESGKVEINSTPAAEVWVADKKLGITPLTVTLPAVSQKISFKKAGFRTVTKTIKPSGETLKKISVALTSEKQAILQEAPAKYTNAAGIQLQLFRPDTTYTMGAPRSEKGQRANEFMRRVMLNKPFYAGLYEVTNKQFSRFKKTGGAINHPVTGISWQDAATFCNWLSKNENLEPFYTVRGGKIAGYQSNANGYRLLSEAEWEWLARKAGKKKQTKFIWGDSHSLPASVANIADESVKGQVKYYIPNYTDGFENIAPVGSFKKEPSGLYDLGGNISEWVHDVYTLSPPDAEIIYVNPLGEVSGISHVIKGANYRSGTLTTIRPAFREGLAQGNSETGFRIGRYLYGD